MPVCKHIVFYKRSVNNNNSDVFNNKSLEVCFRAEKRVLVREALEKKVRTVRAEEGQAPLPLLRGTCQLLRGYL